MIVLHSIACDKRSRPPKPSLAVHSYRPFRLFSNPEEVLHDLEGGNTAIREIQLMMRDLMVFEDLSIVGLIIQPNYRRNLELREDRHIVVGRKHPILP